MPLALPLWRSTRRSEFNLKPCALRRRRCRARRKIYTPGSSSSTVKFATCSGGAYGEAWDSWHRGAAEVQSGLSIMAEAVGAVGVEFDTHENASTQTVDGVYRG
jgi:hypothetical protein